MGELHLQGTDSTVHVHVKWYSHVIAETDLLFINVEVEEREGS